MNACRACGSVSSQNLFHFGTLFVRRCRACTHVYLDASLDSSAILEMYDDYGNDGQSRYFGGIDTEVLLHLDQYLNRCKEFLDTHSEPTLLDVGCGTGALLSRARSLGFKCTGIEICPSLAVLARKQAGCDVYQQFLPDVSFPASSFDVVTMYDLIEHLHDPSMDIREIFRILKPGGLVFALTPNNDAMIRRVSRVLYKVSFHRITRPMSRLYYSDHLSYFTVASLTRLLTSVGFRIVALESANQELSRLLLSKMERIVVGSLFFLSAITRQSGGKLIVYAQKPELEQ